MSFPPKVVFVGDKNWDKIGALLEEGKQVGLHSFAADPAASSAAAASSCDSAPAADLRNKAEERTAQDDSDGPVVPSADPMDFFDTSFQDFSLLRPNKHY